MCKDTAACFIYCEKERRKKEGQKEGGRVGIERREREGVMGRREYC